MSEVFRRCASIVALRRTEEQTYQLLLVHKPRKNDAWQLPQGGAEAGETTEQVALRELREETGLTGRALGVSPIVYEYRFPPAYRKFRPDNVCGQRVEFVFVRLDSDQTIHLDPKEVDDSAWVTPEDLPHYLKRKEYLHIVQQLFTEAARLLR